MIKVEKREKVVTLRYWKVTLEDGMTVAVHPMGHNWRCSVHSVHGHKAECAHVRAVIASLAVSILGPDVIHEPKKLKP